MNPQVEATVIEGAISLGGTAFVAFLGFRTEQREQLDKTLREQREQLDKTLAEQHLRTLNERFATAAEKLGGDKPPASGLPGCTRWQDWLMTGRTG
jgi:uncharacterized protein HemX